MNRHLAVILLLAACASGESQTQQPICRPVDGAWAVSVRVIDAATGRPVANAVASTLSSVAETDSLGWICLRTFAEPAETLEVRRPGYQDDSLVLSAAAGQTVTRELRLRRVPRPCCDLRGTWSITFRLDSPGARQPKPTARSATGAVTLERGTQPHDDLDSLVRIVRGLHRVDFTPFWGGPVAQDVSTSVFGEGPDLLREVEASVPAGDSVSIVFIPRMTHGSLSLRGQVRGDTIRGVWQQNMYCCGAEGRFVMTRTGPAPPSPSGASERASGYRRTLRRAPPADAVPAGFAPSGNWRPALAIAPNGQLWFADGGLFVADSFGAPWRRVLGGNADPVDGDELRVGIEIVFVDNKTVLVGLPERWAREDAPVLYRTQNGGKTWSSVALDSLRAVAGMSAVGQSVWLSARVQGPDEEVMLESADGGKTWRRMPVPAMLRDVNLMHRVSASTAYVASSGREGRPALWRTRDGGRTWESLPTPSEQRLQVLEEHDSRVEQVATIGALVLVREHGRVFASATDPVRWRALNGIEEIASEPAGEHVFVLLDSLRPALLDQDLRVHWRSERRLPLAGSYLEQTSYRHGAGYVTEGHGAIHQVRNKTLRVVRPVAGGGAPESVKVLIDARP